MRILLVHNRYQQPGGEDVTFEQERDLLEDAGHQVIAYERNNSEISDYTLMQKLALAPRTIWAMDSAQEIRKILARDQPQVAHFYNTFPLISPAAYYVCRRQQVPVVQKLANYRLLCPAWSFVRNGKICEKCLGKTPPWPGVWHACYRNSRAQSAAVASMITFHRWLRTWDRQVDIFVALTEFSRAKFIQGGLPDSKIVVKPNFLHPDPGGRTQAQDYALFVGRLSVEKGLRTLLEAWQSVPDLRLKIAGDGPLLDEIKVLLRDDDPRRIELLGIRPRKEVIKLMQGAQFLAFPSIWYEGLPNTLIEAFACGLPVIASRLGAMGELIEDRRTGLHFEAGDAADLAAKIKWALLHPDSMAQMGSNARVEYRTKYTAERNYDMLMNIYRTVTANAKQ